MVERARAEGAERLEVFEFDSGVARGDVADVRRLLAWFPRVDIVHVHRGKEHWLTAVANRLSSTPRPLVRTRHIVQAVRPHPGNRWLYRRATPLVHTVTETIRRQYIEGGLVAADRVVALPGGVDTLRYRPAPPDVRLRSRLGADARALLVGLVAGLRVMKGHSVAIEAASHLGASADRVRFAFVGTGSQEGAIRTALEHHRLSGRIALAGFATDVPSVLAALDVALYVPLESEGMSRMVFEYLAAGRPLIAARVGIVPEILRHGEHALLVPAGDAPALREALIDLLDDAALRARLGAAGRALVSEHYSGARLAEALERLYARLGAA